MNEQLADYPPHFQHLLSRLADARWRYPDLCLVCRHNPAPRTAQPAGNGPAFPRA